ncbi:MAG: alpha-amylase family glycosyl hydrolase [Bacteroidales bacterium]|nr:alpha-amylase family glycosyl hydrolase [Bacteroidales bacterium]MDD3664852.1 alpha-amylase family glycosyl hydrolase [Bacteroidales bacterium]
MTKIASGITRWQTIFSVAATGGDIAGGNYNWLFTSGPTSNAFANKWAGATVTINTLQNYTYNTGADNNITLTNGKWYTMNWKDNGYADAQAIFMETSAQPVNISNVTSPATVNSNTPATITITLSAAKSAEEIVYLRYTTNGWTNSSLVVASFTGTNGTAQIPGQPNGTGVSYYVFSSTVASITGDYDLYTIKLNNNGGSNYTYAVGDPVISWANLQAPASGTIAPSSPYNVFAQALIPGLTGQATPAAGLQAWIGYSTTNTNPNTWTNWIAAPYYGIAGNNDEFMADLGSQIATEGTYYYASRFKLGTGSYVYGGYSASGGGFWDGTINENGVLTISTPDIGWCNLQHPGSGAIAPQQNYLVYGQAWIDGLTGQGSATPGLQAWVGYSSANSDPATWTNWTPTEYHGASGNNDEFMADLSNYLNTDGTYYYTFRYKYLSDDYVYGGYNVTTGGFWNGTDNVSGVLTISTPVINWANLQFPASNTIEPGQPFTVYGQVYIEGRTGSSTSFPTMQVWVGYSPDNSNPETWTDWIEASYNGSQGNNDEYSANIGTSITAEGSYYYATRYKIYDQDFVYGGYSTGGGGFWDGTTNVNGSLTVGIDIYCSQYLSACYSEPAMPKDDEGVTIYFDASKGNGALLNYEGDVYAHTGVLTNLSANSNDWRYTKTGWGVNTPSTKLTRESANLYSLTINTPRSYYGVPASEIIQKMVFVFRSDVVQSNGSYLEHRDTDGSDLAVAIVDEGVNVRFNNPTEKQTVLNSNTSFPVCITARGHSDLALYANNTLIAENSDSELSYMLIMAQLQSGQNWIKAVASDGVNQARDSIEVYLRGSVTIADLPGGVQNGINYINDSTVTLVLHDPTGFKQFVYVIGEFNNWEISDEYYMRRTPDGKRYWTTLTGLTAGVEYAFQYYIDGEQKLADAYSRKVLDPWNDQWISSTNYPDLKPYPSGATDGVVSVLQTAKPAYNWQVTSFTPPAINNAQSDLVIYELLIRDFVESRWIEDVQQKLDYLQELGVNAIELMPIAEFDGNESWGYSTNFFFATDKYYGTENAIKAFIDAAHQKGIAIILDIVPNHTFGLNPMAQMYFNSSANQPSEHNPWLNQQSPHGFSVGYDFNHESGHTRQFFKDVFQYWLTEFKIDGFRIDLSKGLTQNYSGGDIGAWNAYDQSRINILNDYKAHIKWVNPNAYVILEHFADNSEETVLANSGFLLWSAMHGNYKQVAMGWENNSNVSWAFHGSRGWSYPNLVDYMETHDEERMMSEALTNGNSNNPMYDIKWFGNALHHQEQAAVLFMGIPGPKMLYQFQELGYDYSIFYGGGRTASKPPRWDYLDVPGRERLNRVFSAMATLRKTDAFRYGNFYHELGLSGKKMWITHNSMDVIVTVNMGVSGFDMTPGFTKTGTWYDYFTGESFYVSDPGGHFFFYGPGDYKVFTSQPMPKPFHDLNISVLDETSSSPIESADLLLSNAGHRTTASDGTASFLSLPKTVEVTASKFGYIANSETTTVSGTTNLTILLQPGWDPSDGWVNLQYPSSGAIEPEDEFMVYAQVWIDGVTTQVAPDTTIEAWIGYSLTNTNPSTWINWIPATYHQAVGNNDEYKADIGSSITSTGTYYFASRFRKGNSTYAYGGYSSSTGGFWNGTTHTSGTLEVGLPTIDWANLQHPGSSTITFGQDFNVYSRVFMSDKTASAGATTGLQAWIGFSTTNTNPSTWTTWIPASYNTDINNNDEYVANIGAHLPGGGTVYYASRFQYKTGEYVYGGYSSSGGGFWDGATYLNGTLTINPTTVINWANLYNPGSGSVSTSEEFIITSRVLVSNLTGQASQTPGLQAWAGYSTLNTHPSTWSLWIPATYTGPAAGSDEFEANLGSQLSTEGTYYYAFRFKLNNGSYYYGGYSAGGGGFWNGTTNISGNLQVTASTKTLTISSVFPEGLYSGGGLLRQAFNGSTPQFDAGIADVVNVELHDQNEYQTIIHTIPNVPLSTSGVITTTVPGQYSQSYYIGIKHRNSLEISSALPVSFSTSQINYSFDIPNKAYGSNMGAATDGYYFIFAGDVNQDGIVDNVDIEIVTSQAQLFNRGYYSSDINGDGMTDALDIIVIDNNASQNRIKIIP